MSANYSLGTTLYLSLHQMVFLCYYDIVITQPVRSVKTKDCNVVARIFKVILGRENNGYTAGEGITPCHEQNKVFGDRPC